MTIDYWDAAEALDEKLGDAPNAAAAKTAAAALEDARRASLMTLRATTKADAYLGVGEAKVAAKTAAIAALEAYEDAENADTDAAWTAAEHAADCERLANANLETARSHAERYWK